MEKKKSIKEELDKLYGVTDEEINGIILGQRIEDEEDKLKILKELVGYKSFEDYVNDHEKEFEKVDISDDFKMIIIYESVYPEIDLGILKKMGIIVDHYGLTVYIIRKEPKEEDKKRERTT
jgi:putative ribosome biogenesis GTPase RsgA